MGTINRASAGGLHLPYNRRDHRTATRIPSEYGLPGGAGRQRVRPREATYGSHAPRGS
ncbi:hypothetical protein PSEUDO8O_30988 [Pseudomonas sp. 8O]|nr:hypothetical protein PSEUDO8O_30988 [Pseudomonas sp. 8O]